MKLPLFEMISLAVILVVMVFLVWYLWDLFSGKSYQPASWQEAIRQKRISPELRRLERYYPDKVRFFNWWIQSERLRKEGIEGAFAELGVYKGESARILHRIDPQRKLFLFDTFSGFPERDLEGETGEAATYTTKNFADTAVGKVMGYIAGNGNVVPVPGYFPASATGLANEVFSLVNIDADLYKPTLAGLEFFYPRLAAGGVIVVHDYNHKWEGVIRAVEEFAVSTGVIPVLLPDVEGTLMLFKNKESLASDKQKM